MNVTMDPTARSLACVLGATAAQRPPLMFTGFRTFRLACSTLPLLKFILLKRDPQLNRLSPCLFCLRPRTRKLLVWRFRSSFDDFLILLGQLPISIACPQHLPVQHFLAFFAKCRGPRANLVPDDSQVRWLTKVDVQKVKTLSRLVEANEQGLV